MISPCNLHAEKKFVVCLRARLLDPGLGPTFDMQTVCMEFV